MFLSLSIVIVLSITGSYLCFYKSEFLSENIAPIQSSFFKKMFSFFIVIGGVVLCLIFNPKNLLDWTEFIFLLAFYCIAWVDAFSKIIPNKLLIVLITLATLKFLLLPGTEYLVAFLIAIVVFFLAYIVQKRFSKKKYIGWGDFKLVTILALFSGREVLLIIYLGIVLAGIFALAGIQFKKIEMHSRIPLAPFFYIGFMIINFII